MTLKILTYNIHKGFDWGKRNYFLKDIKSLVQSSNANIVLLQEVVGKNFKYQKKGLTDLQFEYIADSVWAHYSYAKNAVNDHGDHGNLILSEYPIQSWKNINISTNLFEKRGFLICKIKLPKSTKKSQKYLYIGAIHLDLLHRGRHRQYKMIQENLKKFKVPPDAPLILGGDFNDWNKQASNIFEKELHMVEAHKAKHGIFAKTFPAAFPLLSLDRIYVKNLKVIQSYVLPKTNERHFSDHLPLFCEVELEKL